MQAALRAAYDAPYAREAGQQVIHLRIVVPSYQAQNTLELLDGTPSVCNLVYLERAARRPQGDVILCDVAREDASVVVADLRELDIDEEGSIAIEEIDSVVGRASHEVEEAHSILDTDPVVWEELDSKVKESVELSFSFLIFMVIAMQIAAVGIYFNQVILIVAAMIVGPEFGPLSGVCVALVSREPALARRSLKALAVGFPLGTFFAFLTTLFFDHVGQLPASINFDSHTLTSFISHPDLFSLFIAVLAGVVGMLSLTSPKSSALIGVLVSVTTIPAAANIGVAAAYADWHSMFGAALQLIINLSGIVIAGVLTLYVQRLMYVRRRRMHLDDETRKIAGLPVGRSRRHRVEPSEEVDAV